VSSWTGFDVDRNSPQHGSKSNLKAAEELAKTTRTTMAAVWGYGIALAWRSHGARASGERPLEATRADIL
jgi:hypothetical protein